VVQRVARDHQVDAGGRKFKSGEVGREAAHGAEPLVFGAPGQNLEHRRRDIDGEHVRTISNDEES
jgi:hypothetical protein